MLEGCAPTPARGNRTCGRSSRPRRGGGARPRHANPAGRALPGCRHEWRRAWGGGDQGRKGGGRRRAKHRGCGWRACRSGRSSGGGGADRGPARGGHGGWSLRGCGALRRRDLCRDNGGSHRSWYGRRCRCSLGDGGCRRAGLGSVSRCGRWSSRCRGRRGHGHCWGHRSGPSACRVNRSTLGSGGDGCRHGRRGLGSRGSRRTCDLGCATCSCSCRGRWGRCRSTRRTSSSTTGLCTWPCSCCLASHQWRRGSRYRCRCLGPYLRLWLELWLRLLLDIRLGLGPGPLARTLRRGRRCGSGRGGSESPCRGSSSTGRAHGGGCRLRLLLAPAALLSHVVPLFVLVLVLRLAAAVAARLLAPRHHEQGEEPRAPQALKNELQKRRSAEQSRGTHNSDKKSGSYRQGPICLPWLGQIHTRLEEPVVLQQIRDLDHTHAAIAYVGVGYKHIARQHMDKGGVVHVATGDGEHAIASAWLPNAPVR